MKPDVAYIPRPSLFCKIPAPFRVKLLSIIGSILSLKTISPVIYLQNECEYCGICLKSGLKVAEEGISSCNSIHINVMPDTEQALNAHQTIHFFRTPKENYHLTSRSEMPARFFVNIILLHPLQPSVTVTKAAHHKSQFPQSSFS